MIFAPTTTSRTVSLLFTIGLILCICPDGSWSWSFQPQQHSHHGSSSVETSRRDLLSSAAGLFLVLPLLPQPALAVPMVTVDEFDIILRDSPRSIRIVEFSGPKSENIAVKLVDGTTFGIKDIVESSTDPRSPLKVSADCRENGVPTKFVDLQAMLVGSTTKSQKKLYTNQRVRDAQLKETDRLERIRQDEEDRLAQVARMEQQQ